MSVMKGRFRLSARVIFALLGVAVLQPANHDQRVLDEYFLTLGNSAPLINDWWGRADEFHKVAAEYSMPLVKLNFGEWMDGLR
jgi:hypothetical protein